MRTISYGIIGLIVFFCLVISPEMSTADMEGIIPGTINVSLYKSGTGMENGGVTSINSSIGDTISVDVYLNNPREETVTGIEIYLTVDERYFNIVSQGRAREGSLIPFIQGIFMKPAQGALIDLVGNYTHGDSTRADNNRIPGWQLDYIEQSGPDLGSGRPVSQLRYGVACTFKLVAKAPGENLTISLDDDQYYARRSRYYKPRESNDFFFKTFQSCSINISGFEIDPPLPDIMMTPGTTDTSLDLDNNIESPSIPDGNFNWLAAGNLNVGVSIDPASHIVTFTAPPAFKGYENITFSVGTVDQPSFDSDVLSVTVDHPPVFNRAVMPDTLFIYEDSLHVAFYLPAIVSDADDPFADLAWDIRTGNNLTWLTTNIPADTLKIMGVRNFFGIDYLELTVRDGLGRSDTQRTPVRVYPVNDTPVFSDLPDVTFVRGRSSTLNMSQYVTDPDGDVLTLTVQPSVHFAVAVSGLSVTIAEIDSYLGSEVLVFTATDPSGLSDTASLTATVTPLTDPPVWSEIQKIGFPQNQSSSSLILWDYVDDPDGTDAQLTFTFSDYDDVDSVFVSPITGRLYLYDLDDRPGWDMMTVKATDSDGHDASTRFLVFIGPADGTPIAAAIPDTTIQAGTIMNWIDLDNYYYDVDNTDADMAWTYAHANGNNLVVADIDEMIHTVRLGAPDPDSSGPDRLVFTVTDSDGKSASDDCVITVLGISKPVLDMPSKVGFVTGQRAIIDLDRYVQDPQFPDSLLTWSWTGNMQIEIDYETESDIHSKPLYFTSSGEWTGWEKVYFYVENPFGETARDSTLVFSVPVDGSSVAGGLGRVRVKAGMCDSLDIDLDDYYYDADTPDWGMTWSVSGNDSVTVTIDTSTHTVRFCSPSLTFEGEETVTLTVSDGVHVSSMNVTVEVYGAIWKNIFSIKLFRNPMQSDYMDIYLKSILPLLGIPTLEVLVVGDSTRVRVSTVVDTLRYYHGSYLLPYTASLGLQRDAVVLASGTTQDGKTVQDTLTFAYGRLGPGGGKISLGKVAVTVPEGALKVPETLTLVANKVEPDVSGKMGVTEVLFQDEVYTLAPVNLETGTPLDISWSLCCRTDGAGIYHAVAGGWEFVGGSVSDGAVHGETDHGGTFRLGYDRTPPVVTVLGSVDGMVRFTVDDFGSGVDRGSVSVLHRDENLSWSFDADSGVFTVSFGELFEETEAGILITVSDRVGNTTSESSSVRVKPGPDVFMIEQNTPNPFNPSTTITFRQSSGRKVTIEIYDILGRKVCVLANGYYSAGSHSLLWNATDDQGRTVSSGVYIYRVLTEKHMETRKMLFMR